MSIVYFCPNLLVQIQHVILAIVLTLMSIYGHIIEKWFSPIKIDSCHISNYILQT